MQSRESLPADTEWLSSWSRPCGRVFAFASSPAPHVPLEAPASYPAIHSSSRGNRCQLLSMSTSASRRGARDRLAPGTSVQMQIRGDMESGMRPVSVPRRGSRSVQRASVLSQVLVHSGRGRVFRTRRSVNIGFGMSMSDTDKDNAKRPEITGEITPYESIGPIGMPEPGSALPRARPGSPAIEI